MYTEMRRRVGPGLPQAFLVLETSGGGLKFVPASSGHARKFLLAGAILLVALLIAAQVMLTGECRQQVSVALFMAYELPAIEGWALFVTAVASCSNGPGDSTYFVVGDDRSGFVRSLLAKEGKGPSRG